MDGRKLTTREQVERHRADKGCASCHARIDPLGFALETFDVIGRWRTEDEGGPIDPSDTLASGETIDGFEGLKNHLLRNPEPFVHATVARLMTYALGRQLDARDEPTIRAILRRTEAKGYRFGDLILAIAESVPFQMRQAPGSQSETRDAPCSSRRSTFPVERSFAVQARPWRCRCSTRWFRPCARSG
ncbi:MAG: DUF1585 domain-containing protein [Bryobacterales bacterium]